MLTFTSRTRSTMATFGVVLCVPFFNLGCGTSSSAGSGASGTLFDVPTSSNVTGDSVVGLWVVTESDPAVDIRMRFSRTELTVAYRCNASGARPTLFASVSAPIRLTDAEMTVLEAKQDLAESGIYQCSAQVAAAVATFSVKDAKLELRDAGATTSLVKVSD